MPGLLPNLGLFVVSLTGGAVAVEQIFDIPGLGQLTLRAALAQDLPVLQTGTLALVLLAAVVSALARLAARLLIGPGLRDGALHSLHPPAPPTRSILPLLYGALLAAVIGLGLPRDPLALNPAARLQPPSYAHVFGTDALGRDILARVAHGALTTLGIALAVSAAALITGVLLGLLPRLSGPVSDTINAIPPVLAGLLVTGLAGSGPWTPAIAVAIGAWTPWPPTPPPSSNRNAPPLTSPPPAPSAPRSGTCSPGSCSQPSCRPSSATPCSACPASP